MYKRQATVKFDACRIFTARCTIVHSAVFGLRGVRPSVRLQRWWIGGRASSVHDRFGTYGGPLRYSRPGLLRYMSKKTSVHRMDDFGTFTYPVRYINFGTLIDRYKTFVIGVFHILKSSHARANSPQSTRPTRKPTCRRSRLEHASFELTHALRPGVISSNYRERCMSLGFDHRLRGLGGHGSSMYRSSTSLYRSSPGHVPKRHVPKWYSSLCTELVMYRSGPAFKFVKKHVPKWYVPKWSCTELALTRSNWPINCFFKSCIILLASCMRDHC